MNKDAVAEMSQQYQVEAAEKLVPEGYKQTEVGVTNSSGTNLNATCGGPQGGGMDSRRIPEDWEVSTIGSLTDWMSGGTPRRSNEEFWRGTIPWISGSTLKESLIFTSDQFLSESGVAAGSKIAPINSVLLLVRGSALHKEIRAGKVLNPVAFNQDVKALIPSNKLSAMYLTFFILGMESELLKLVSSAGNSAGVLDTALIKNFILLMPPIKEQTAIANALSDTDALLSELEKLIAKKQAIKTATMQQLLTGRTRLPQFANHPDGSKKGYKQSELGEIPEDWELIELGEITTFLKGAGLPKSDLIDSGKNRCIHYGQLFTSYGPKIEKIFSSTDIDGSIKSETNDVLMPTSDVTPNGLATASCILESGIVLGGDILIIRSKKELLDGVFFAYLITVMRDQIMQLVTGSTVYHLYGSDMAKFLFAKPVFEEQTTIATILADMDEEIQALEHRLNKTRQIKQGMMQELLTGKTRLVVPQD